MESPTHYHWSPAGALVSAKLSFQVLDEILQETLRGFGAVPKRGAEIGGILLGRFEGSDCVIDAAQPVPCDYKLGPGYEFTDTDWQRFGNAVTGKDSFVPVGFYRSQTSDGFAPSAEDLRRLNDFFPDPRAALLLVKPFATRISRGGFFFRENGMLPSKTEEEFPFSRKMLGGGERPARREETKSSPPPPSVKEAEREAAPVLAPAPPPVNLQIPPPLPPLPPKPAPRVNRGVWAAIIFLAVALGWAAGFLTNRNLPSAPSPEVFTIRLMLAARGGDLDVQWNPAAAAIRTARRGSIRVKNDAGEKAVALDLDQLRQGRVIVREATSSSVLVELEIEQIAGSTLREFAIFSPQAARQ